MGSTPAVTGFWARSWRVISARSWAAFWSSIAWSSSRVILPGWSASARSRASIWSRRSWSSGSGLQPSAAPPAARSRAARGVGALTARHLGRDAVGEGRRLLHVLGPRGPEAEERADLRRGEGPERADAEQHGDKDAGGDARPAAGWAGATRRLIRSRRASSSSLFSVISGGRGWRRQVGWSRRDSRSGAPWRGGRRARS